MWEKEQQAEAKAEDYKRRKRLASKRYTDDVRGMIYKARMSRLVHPSPATHVILTELKAGERMFQIFC